MKIMLFLGITLVLVGASVIHLSMFSNTKYDLVNKEFGIKNNRQKISGKVLNYSILSIIIGLLIVFTVFVVMLLSGDFR